MRIYTETEGQKWPSGKCYKATWNTIPGRPSSPYLAPPFPGSRHISLLMVSWCSTIINIHHSMFQSMTYVWGWIWWDNPSSPFHLWIHEGVKWWADINRSTGLARGARPRQVGEKLLNNLNLRCTRIIAKRMKSLAEKEIRTIVRKEKNKQMATC